MLRDLPRNFAANLAHGMWGMTGFRPMSTARPPEGAHTAAEGEGTPSFAARPPEGAHTAAEGEGAPSFAARPSEGAHTVAEGEGTPVSVPTFVPACICMTLSSIRGATLIGHRIGEPRFDLRRVWRRAWPFDKAPPLECHLTVPSPYVRP
ncbi:hypothetical protein [Verminephrobacter eiseniae]|uniref:hypothetical protein n=1 Tax=Verminephrobacter eiseniae TaxID=364317 RepID=UPI002237B91A|nr:hypothetical protein [Verminephrobacter eiseniae]